MKIKKGLINLICLFIPFKNLRKNFRNKILNKDNVKTLSHSLYGKIYLPLYNLECDISTDEPKRFNANGGEIKTYFLRDLVTAHNPYSNSKYFEWDRFNFGLKTHFYTHKCMLETLGNPDKKYGMLIESEAIVPDDYKIFQKNKGLEKDFDLIFTYSENILEKVDNAVFVPFCAQIWFGSSVGGGVIKEDAYKFKNKNISICSSDKIKCSLHKFRLELARKLKKEQLADTFGTFDGGCHINIAETLTDYRYSFAIENIVSPLFFTERLTNCFISMTIPIYLGASKIDEFFNPEGIIKISEKDFDNIENILKQCTKEEYERRFPAVIDNFKRVQKYLNIFDSMYEEYLNYD